MNDIDQLLEEVKDRESFLAFVKALIRDREEEVKLEKENPSLPYGPGRNGWENGTIEGYLEAAVAWVEDWKGKEHELPHQPSWRSFAQFLYAGKFYE